MSLLSSVSPLLFPPSLVQTSETSPHLSSPHLKALWRQRLGKEVRGVLCVETSRLSVPTLSGAGEVKPHLFDGEGALVNTSDTSMGLLSAVIFPGNPPLMARFLFDDWVSFQSMLSHPLSGIKDTRGVPFESTLKNITSCFCMSSLKSFMGCMDLSPTDWHKP